MARATFGATAADFIMQVGPGGLIRVASGVLTMWTAQTGGTQVTDLMIDAVPVTEIPVGSDGNVPAFQGPDGVTLLWADAGYGRVRLQAGGDLPTMVDESVTAELASHTAGLELGYASRTSTFTSTNTVSTNAAGNITGLSVTVVGQGRPVDVRFHAASVYHTLANTGVSVVIMRDGNATGADSQIGAVLSQSTTTGPSLTIQRRTNPLTAGVSATFTARVWGAATGTCTLVAAAFCPLELSVTSR